MSGWRETPRAQMAPDGRLRLSHGPIDLIVTVDGPAPARQSALIRARDAFAPVLHDLVGELPGLRSDHGPTPLGAVARRMYDATAPFAPIFVTPMAAVAGSVADHILAAILTGDHGLTRAHVNNGGDIALWLANGAMTAAICDNPVKGTIASHATITATSGIGGIATSGWRGRSHSLGIADAVTVLARNAAAADAAATLIANAVDLPDHPAITRERACDLSPDSDLGTRLVTTGVGNLTAQECGIALDKGLALAEEFQKRGLIHAAYLAVQGAGRMIGETVTGRELEHA